MKSVVLGTFLLSLTFANVVYAKKTNAKPIVCNMAVLKATTEIDDDAKTMSAVSVTVNETDYGNGSAEIVVGGKKVEINLMINGDELVSGVLEVAQSSLIDGQLEIRSGGLMKNAGIGKGSGWDHGPTGATQWRLMLPNSLNEASINASLSASAFLKLKKRGVSSPRLDNLFPVYEKIAAAVKAGDLVEGEPIGTALFMGCYQ
ncbi:MAG: hypothetical protein IPM97_06200 [Bdellovibrionaceae bacterium]|nr:hypothetical protein [Pseudobdellovibrionaceae bacterium]